MLNKFALLHGRTSPLTAKLIMAARQYHSVARPAASVIASESPILVYDSAEFKSLSGISRPSATEQPRGHIPSVYEERLGLSKEDAQVFNQSLRPPDNSNIAGSFAGSLGSTEYKAKVYSLLPFLVESAFTSKNFVLRLQVYPQANMLQFDTLQFSGVETIYMPTEQLIPITRQDYWCAASWRPFFKQNTCLDLDMVYANKNTKEMFLFDKHGEWHDEGVYHEALGMDRTYNETNWYDEFNPHNFM